MCFRCYPKEITSTSYSDDQGIIKEKRMMSSLKSVAADLHTKPNDVIPRGSSERGMLSDCEFWLT